MNEEKCKHEQLIDCSGEKVFCDECGKARCTLCGMCFDAEDELVVIQT